jgi:hypothetical protein
LVVILSPQRPWFDPRSVHVISVVDKVAVGLGFLGVRFSPVRIIQPVLHTQLHVRNLVRRTSGKSLDNFKVMLSLISDGTGHKYVHFQMVKCRQDNEVKSKW